MSSESRKARLAARKDGRLDTAAFLKSADKFIDLANRENAHVQATELHLAFLFAAARYNAYVGKAVLEVANHEEYVTAMVEQYRDMLRQHLADDGLATPKQPAS